MSKRKRKKIVVGAHSDARMEAIGLLHAISVVSARLARNLARLELQKGQVPKDEVKSVSTNAHKSDAV